MILAGLSSSFGGGIKLTPHCKKGILALSVFKNLGVRDIFLYLPYIFNGSVDKLSKIEMRHCHVLEVKSLSNPHAFYLEADGEYIGSGQMQIRIAPLSLHFILPVK
jgi:diacylglycerol kinase family enzyme